MADKTLTKEEAFALVTDAYTRQKTKHSTRNTKYRKYRNLFENDYDAWWPVGGDDTYGLPARPIAGRYSLTLNYFAPIVLKIAGFIMADKIDFKVTPDNPSPEERIGAQKAEKILYKVHKRSKYRKTLNEVALDSAKLDTGWAKVLYDKEAKQVYYVYADPECIYAEPYKSLYSGKLLYVVQAYEMNLEDAREEFGDDVDIPKITESEQKEGRDADDQTAEPQVSVIEYWSMKRFIQVVGNQVKQNKGNEYGFIPYTPFPLLPRPGQIEGQGVGDWMIEANGYYNQAVSQGADAQALNCNPPIWYRNAPVDYRDQFRAAAGGGVLSLTRDGEVGFLTWPGQPPSVEAMLDRMLSYIHDVSHIPRIAFGELSAQTNSSRVVGVQYDPIVKVMKLIRDNYDVALTDLNEKLLRLVEKYETSRKVYHGYIENGVEVRRKKVLGEEPEIHELKGKDVAGHYETEIIWPGVLPKDDINAGQFELQKHHDQVQSKWTTQEKLGITNPEDEMEILRSELSDETLYPKEQAAALAGEAKGLQALVQAQQAQQGQEPEGEMFIPERGGAAGFPGPEPTPPTPEEIENSNAQLFTE